MYFQVKVKAHRDHRMCPSVTFKCRDELYLLQPQTTARILLEIHRDRLTLSTISLKLSVAWFNMGNRSHPSAITCNCVKSTVLTWLSTKQ